MSLSKGTSFESLSNAVSRYLPFSYPVGIMLSIPYHEDISCQLVLKDNHIIVSNYLINPSVTRVNMNVYTRHHGRYHHQLLYETARNAPVHRKDWT